MARSTRDHRAMVGGLILIGLLNEPNVTAPPVEAGSAVTAGADSSGG